MSSQGQGANPTSTDVGFVQQGEVDWVAFSKSTVSMSVEILGRFQAAGVQEITYAGALQLTTRFALPEKGRRRVWDAIRQLKVYGVPANMLYFGFGHRSFLRFLSESVSGLKCIALCSCLAEMHTEDVAARVISALWKEFGYPEDIEPSHHQFKSLIKACGGAMANSPFPEIAGQMFSIRDRNIVKKPSLQCSEPQDIAKALRALFEISTGTRNSVTVVGGAECSFIAAISFWLFDLSVYAEDGSGQLVFRSSTAGPVDHDTAQVHVRYMDQQPLSQVVVARSTFVLRNPEDMLIYTPDSRLLCIRTRVSWDCCLRYTFGEAFADLLSRQTALGDLLGAAARIYMALAEGEVDVGGFSRLDFVDFIEASYGVGFLQSVGDIFPELAEVANLVGHARTVLTEPVQLALLRIQRSIGVLERSCLCPVCNLKESVRIQDDTGTGEFQVSDALCLLALATTLVELVTTIACTAREPSDNLRPTPAGLSLIYEKNRRCLHNRHQSANISAGQILHLNEANSEHSLPPKNVANIMANLLCIFTGYELSRAEQDLCNWRTAVCDNGICVFIEGLVSMTARAELLRRIHIIPGHIARGSRTYDSIWDGAPTSAPVLESLELLPGVQAVGPDEDGQDIPAAGDMIPLVSEPGGTGQLAVFYRISTLRGHIIVLPGLVTAFVLKNTGRIPCQRSDCPLELDARVAFYTTTKGWSLSLQKVTELVAHGVACCSWEHTKKSEVARLAAIALHRGVYYGSVSKTAVLVRRDECLSCFTKACPSLFLLDGLGGAVVHIV